MMCFSIRVPFVRTVHIRKTIFQNCFFKRCLLKSEVSTISRELLSFAVLYSELPRMETMLLSNKICFQFLNLLLAHCE